MQGLVQVADRTLKRHVAAGFRLQSADWNSNLVEKSALLANDWVCAPVVSAHDNSRPDSRVTWW